MGVWVEVLNGSRNAISSVSEVSSLVNLRALILNSMYTHCLALYCHLVIVHIF